MVSDLQTNSKETLLVSVSSKAAFAHLGAVLHTMHFTVIIC